MKRRMLHTWRSCGFTLIELLVATAIMCVLVVLLSNMITSTMRVVGQSQRFFDLHSKARAALDQLSRDLGQGIYRSDILSFSDGYSSNALAFYTRRSGAFSNSSTATNYRQLVFVRYEAGYDTNSSNFTLRRGTISPSWADTSTYPEASLTAAMPFASNSTAASYATMATNLSRMLDGVARLEVRFLGSDGVYRKTYYSSTNTSTNSTTYLNATNDTNALAKAIAVTVLVVDDKTQNFFSNNPNTLATFRANFLDPTQKLKSPDGTNASLASVWDKALGEPATWDGIPERARNGIYCFERIIPLR